MVHKTLQGLIAAAAMGALVSAQQPGNVTAEVHPELPTWKCTTDGGCVEQKTSIVLDWNYRWFHNEDASASCTTSTGVDPTLCPDQETCTQNCYVEGVDYAASGITTDGNALTLRQFVADAETGELKSVSPRAYLLDESGDYVSLQLLNQELSFDVDLSTLPCGENAALYLSEMDLTGGRSASSPGGAAYGGAYCDAQCPVQNWNNGTLNTDKVGSCCNEMDILEANSFAEAFTPHPCIDDSCDKGGCGFNSYAKGNKQYFGPGLTLDTSKPFTMVTQFITDDGTANGKLTTITRYYVQNGQKVASAVEGGDSITADACSSAEPYGKLQGMGEALGRGMVLALSIWNDAGGFMNWLDSGSNGPCTETEGDPVLIQANAPDSQVVLSNIRWGDIDSTLESA
ncbi:concanavalin A-like lectin/glucanase domain-containing protein [Chaetomium sp. MPI-SDFR-AT-0129]|nr:concanavalin A-like lectin/glucanase domain-containing protein [Chaetomium sp. MPI-SDFR-AT-0129]